MCTLTIIPLPGGYRLATNRDEKRSRPRAEGPASHSIGATRALWPTDTLAGGSWVAVADSGLTLSIQNVNPTPPVQLPPALVSRGVIIPKVVCAGSAEAAIVRLKRMTLDAHAPFRLVAVDEREIVEARWDRSRLEIARRPLEPACFVTSGLGDALAAPRVGLWELFLTEHGPTAAMQDEYHRHYWPDRPEISVMMSREAARTVSTTSVEVTRHGGAIRARMAHRDDGGVRRLQLEGSAAEVAAVATGAPGGDDRSGW
jgi:hypothetical protein